GARSKRPRKARRASPESAGRSASASGAERSARARAAQADPAALAALADDDLLEAVQRRTFRYFWDGAHPASGLAFDRRTSGKRSSSDDPVTVGGSGFGVMALIVAAERGWVTR